MAEIEGDVGAGAGAVTADPVAELLNQALAENPHLRLVAELMRRQGEAASEQRRAAPPAQTPERVLARYERLRESYAALWERMEALAAALGACPRCWGEDPGCPRCRGRGDPGAHPSDAALFTHYVLPAVRRRQARVRRTPAASPAAGTANIQEE